MKLISKIASLSVGLALAVGVGVTIGSKEAKVVKADDVTITPSQFTGATQTEIEQTVGDFTFSISSQGTITSDQVRVFKGSTLTISISSGSITEIEMTCTASGTTKYGPGCFAAQDGYSYDGAVGTWTGDAASVSFTASSNQVRITQFVITYGGSKTITSITLSKDDASVKKSYYAGEVASTVGLTVTAHYDDSSSADVTSLATITANPSTVALSTASITYSATLGEKTSNSVTVSGITVSKANQIQAIYTQAKGASIDVYGYYVGYLTHTNKDGTITYYDVIIQDGEYGIMAYGLTTQPTYTINETVLHVTGTLSIYNGLYEVGSPTVSEATSIPQDRAPSAAVVYAAKGGETADYASRLTTVTGIPSYSGTIGNAGDSDLTLDFAVGEKNVQVFYKKAAQNADADAFAAVKAAVAGSSEITIKGFTGWYNGFQVQMNGYIPPAADYTAEQFAQDLLDQTDAVCAGWKEGDNNHDAIEAIWSDLASNDKYPSLPAAQKTILADAERDESGTVVEQAMARYDFLTGKYNLSNFINGRTPIASSGMMNYGELDLANNSTIVIVISIATVSALAFTLLLVFKKKKHN